MARPRKRCPGCEYDLTEHRPVEDRVRCPECGQVWPADRLKRPEMPPLDHLLSRPLAAVIIGAAGGLFLPLISNGLGLAVALLVDLQPETKYQAPGPDRPFSRPVARKLILIGTAGVLAPATLWGWSKI